MRKSKNFDKALIMAPTHELARQIKNVLIKSDYI